MFESALSRDALGFNRCRCRLRQVLGQLEEERAVSQERLLEMVDKSTCTAGHRLIVAAVTGGLTYADDEGRIRLSRDGQDWLLANGRPSPDWRALGASGTHPLRQWQVEALTVWAEHGRHGAIEAVTGTGKSRVGVEAAREALSHDYNVVIVVPTIDLVEQWEKALRQNHVRGIGRLGDGRRAGFATHSVIVGTVQSLFADPPTRPDGKVLLIADECHRYGSEQWKRVLHPSYRRRLGLTATFERNDDGIQGLISYFSGSPVFTIGFARAIEEGVVSRYDVKLLGVDLAPGESKAYKTADKVLRETRTQLLAAGMPESPFGAFMHQVSKAASGEEPDPTIEDVARRYLKAFSERIDIMTNADAKIEVASMLAARVASSHGAIIFTRRIEATKHLADALGAEGIAARPIHSELSGAERKDLLIDLKVGRIKALVAPAVLDEGIDVPDVDLGVVMAGSKSRRQMIQRMGRVLRLKGDGRKATFIVVYARETAEDLTMSNGEEGCLDLIIESADSVEELAQVDNHLVVAGRLSVTGSRRQQGAAIRRQDAPGPESAAFPPPLVPKAPQLNPGDMRLSSGACNAYMRAHGVDEAEAGKDLRQMLVDFVEIGQLTPRPAGLEDYALDHEGFHLVVSEEAVLHYASLRPDANTWADLRPDGEPETSPVEPVPVDPVADPQTSLPSESSPTATSHEAAVPERGGGRPMTRRKVNLRSLDTFYDRIDPQTLSMTLDAVATATHAFGLGDPYSWEALDGVRQRLANDLATSPTVEQGPLGWTVHGEWAQWLVDHEAGRLVSLKPNGQPLAEPALPPDPDAAATSEAAGSEPEKSATLVDQLERLDVLHSAGVLTDDEFTAAKAQLLF